MADLGLRSNLKAILREQGMSQLELAQKINISPTNLNTRLARGRNCQLSLLEDICKILDININRLMYGMQEEHPVEEVAAEKIIYKEKYLEMCEKYIALQEQLMETKELLAKLRG